MSWNIRAVHGFEGSSDEEIECGARLGRHGPPQSGFGSYICIYLTPNHLFLSGAHRGCGVQALRFVGYPDITGNALFA